MRDDMEAAGFAEPDDHPIAGLGPPAADEGFSAAGLTPAVVVTRCGLTEALKGTRQHQHLTLDARGQLADEIMAHLPPASPDARDAEIARLKTELAEKDGLLILAREGAFKS